MAANRLFFRYSAWDALPALCGIGQVTFLLWTFVAFPTLSLWVLVPSFLLVAYCYCWNLQCISHNFIHNPYFRSNLLNSLFGVLETLAIGLPHQLYHHYHLNHHAGDNDTKGPDGTTRDWSSFYRYGKEDKPEAFWRYCLLSFFRVEIGPVLAVARRHGHLGQVALETVSLVAFWVVLALADWRYFVFFYLPSYYLGWVFSYAEGYLEHYGAQPGNPYANSVSSYYWLYNFLWFNNGFHQEHHWDPKVHWTKMQELRERLRPQMQTNHTRILRGPHITALIEEYLERRKTPPADKAQSPQRRAA